MYFQKREKTLYKLAIKSWCYDYICFFSDNLIICNKGAYSVGFLGVTCTWSKFNVHSMFLFRLFLFCFYFAFLFFVCCFIIKIYQEISYMSQEILCLLNGMCQLESKWFLSSKVFKGFEKFWYWIPTVLNLRLKIQMNRKI